MAEETKKISFGFSKLKKTNNLVKPVEINKPQVEYVDSFDGINGKFSYKGNVRSDEPVKKELVIPLIGAKTVLELIKTRLEENERIKDERSKESNGDSKEVKECEEKCVSAGKEEPVKDEAEQKLSIDELAAKEIMNELHNDVSNEKSSKALIIKQASKGVDEKEIPIDYENIPVNDFGLAMLRGMGWTPQTGIGKDQKVVPVVTPKLRPKGLGLGADKVVRQQAAHDPDLVVSLKAYVKLTGGLHRGSYGQVEAMDDSNSRVIVKLALGGTVSVSEILLVPVTKNEYEKNSKVINTSKYEDFKKEDDQVKDNSKNEDNRHRKEKFDRSEERRRDRRDSSSSGSDHKRKKKSHKREESRDRKYKKEKKKRKKKKRHSEDESDSSIDRKYKRESSSRRRRDDHHR